jgi:acyl-coenzyme A synthetase/AMP-(fatty) acid ligase
VEGFGGRKKTYTFDDIRVYSNGLFAGFLQSLGIAPGRAVCVFMDKIPALYISFLGS